MNLIPSPWRPEAQIPDDRLTSLWASCEWWASEKGSALPTVLVFVVVTSILVGSVLLVQALQHRFVRGDIDRLKAHYAAEAGVYRALGDLGSPLHPYQATYRIGGDGSAMVARCSVRVVPFGGLARVFAKASFREEHVRLTALAGKRPPPELRAALLLGDARSSLTLTGDTRIEGTLLLGAQGAERSDFRGQPFTGELHGSVRRRAERKVPPYDTSAYHRALQRADHLLAFPPAPTPGRKDTGKGFVKGDDLVSTPKRSSPWQKTGEGSETASLYFADRRVRVAKNDLTLTEADAQLFNDPVLAIAPGDLTLQGNFSIAPGSIFLAGSRLSVRGRVKGRGALFYGRDTLQVGQSARVAGQFLSRTRLLVEQQAVLAYPSVAFVSGPGRIQVRGRARIDGTVLYPTPSSNAQEKREVTIGPDGQVRGALYNRARTELWGEVHGSVLTFQFGFYRSPTHYVNWLKDATIRRPRRPRDFTVPYGFEGAGRAKVLNWQAEMPP